MVTVEILHILQVDIDEPGIKITSFIKIYLLILSNYQSNIFFNTKQSKLEFKISFNI